MDDSETEDNECLETHPQSNYQVSGVDHGRLGPPQRNQQLLQTLHQVAAGPLDAVFGSTESPHQIPLYPYEALEKDISDTINCNQSRRELDFTWLDDFSPIPHHGQSEEHEDQHASMLVDDDQTWATIPQRDRSGCPQQPTELQDTSSRQQHENFHERSLLRRQYGSTDSHQLEGSSFEQTLTTVSGNWRSLQHPQSLHASQIGESLPPSSRPCSRFGSPPDENANIFHQPPRRTYLSNTHGFQKSVAPKGVQRENERDVDEILALIEDCKCSRGRDCNESRPPIYGPWRDEIKTWDQANALLRSTTWTPPQPDATIPQSDEDKLMWAKRLYNAMMDFTHVHDKGDGKKKNYLLQGIYSQGEIELACWHAVAVAVELHTRGACLSRAADPTQDSHQDWSPNTRKEARRLNFEERLKQVCWWLKVEKACATNIINGVDVSKIIYAPKQMGKSKGDNRYGNEKKRNQISAGKSNAMQKDEECAPGRESDSA